MLLIILGAVLAGAMLIVARTEAQGHGADPVVADVLLVVAVVYGIMLLALPLSLLWQAGAARSRGNAPAPTHLHGADESHPHRRWAPA